MRGNKTRSERVYIFPQWDKHKSGFLHNSRPICNNVAVIRMQSLSFHVSIQCVNLSELMIQRLTLQSGDLSLDWSAGQRVFQGINMDFISSCNLSKMEKRRKKDFSLSQCCTVSTGLSVAAGTIRTVCACLCMRTHRYESANVFLLA